MQSSRQDRGAQALDRNRCPGVTPFTTGIVGGKAIEPRQKRSDAGQHQHGLHDERPRHHSAARWGRARLACNGERHLAFLFGSFPGHCVQRFCTGRCNGATRRIGPGRAAMVGYNSAARTLPSGSLGATGDDCHDEPPSRRNRPVTSDGPQDAARPGDGGGRSGASREPRLRRRADSAGGRIHRRRRRQAAAAGTRPACRRAPADTTARIATRSRRSSR